MDESADEDKKEIALHGKDEIGWDLTGSHETVARDISSERMRYRMRF